MAEIPGVDFSMARPDPSLLVRSGFRFVMGYVSTSPSKNLTAANVRDYIAAGLSVGLVWETTADRALAGSAAGAADGAQADAQADALGYPVDSPIFAAVDQAVSLAQINGPIRAYFTAFDAAQKRPIGAYGSFLVIDTLVTPGVRPVRYGWQTAAWSAGALSSKAHIYQRATPSGHWPVISGTDENVLCLPLPLAGPMHPKPPAPHPPPTPTPTPTPEPPPLTIEDEIMALTPEQYTQFTKDVAAEVVKEMWTATFTVTEGPTKGQHEAEGFAMRDIWQGIRALRAKLGA